MPEKVVKLFKEESYYATCQCGSIDWNLRVDKLGMNWKKILGSECIECGLFISWIIVNQEDEDE